ncbi:MBL fold metallo-hydrolase [Pseudomonas sp. MS646]|uniref:MBL fold metallo-hydrolase n=1 Tax=Pseudomonas sp. MS646 TaxID=3118751 RepID=UPI0030D571F8
MFNKVPLPLATLFTTLVLAGTITSVNAAATPVAEPLPIHKPQVAGVYRFQVGAFQITALSDGTLPLDLHPLLRGISAEKIDALLKKGFIRNPVETSINTYVIDTGPRVLLVDTGAGELFGQVAGKLPQSLAAAGYKLEDISDVLLTHIHADHSGGLSRNRQMMFPNATVHVAQADVDFFLDPANLTKGLKPQDLEKSQRTVGPYVDAGRVKTFSGPTTLVPGITAIPTPGHTPGHSVYRVESQGESIDFWGDLLHVGPVQFARPDVTVTFDVDQDRARAQRQQQFKASANEARLSAAAHLPFPGIGHLRAQAGHYEWVPADYRNRD